MRIKYLRMECTDDLCERSFNASCVTCSKCRVININKEMKHIMAILNGTREKEG